MSAPDWAKPLLHLADRLDAILPPVYPEIDWATTWAASWHGFSDQHGGLEPLAKPRPYSFDDLLAMDRQKSAFRANAQLFLKGWPFNHVLLWGARGTGKSTLVRALLTELAPKGLRLIEVSKNELHQLPRIVRGLAQQPYHFVLFCDDLSFESGDTGYQALKSVLEGSLAQMPENLMVIATSNRRHLVPEHGSDNAGSRWEDSELHMSDAVEEKIALADRFGLAISFYQYSAEDYLAICKAAYHKIAEQIGQPVPEFDDRMSVEAQRFATQRGGRGGRIAHQFARDWIGRYLAQQLG